MFDWILLCLNCESLETLVSSCAHKKDSIVLYKVSMLYCCSKPIVNGKDTNHPVIINS